MKVDEWFDLTFHCPCCSKMLFIKVHVIEQEGNTTATIKTDKEFFIEFLNSDDWITKAILGFNTYRVNVSSIDGRDYIHYRNLMSILRWLYDLITGG